MRRTHPLQPFCFTARVDTHRNIIQNVHTSVFESTNFVVLQITDMINYNPKSWLGMIFHLTKSDTLQILWKELVMIFAFTLVIAFVELHYFPNASVLDRLFPVYQILGFVMSLLLVFRTNTAYDRWWEGRRKWGELVNDSRNLAVKIAALELDEETNAFFARHIGNFAKACKEHLREGVNFEILNLTEDEILFLRKVDHIPSGTGFHPQ